MLEQILIAKVFNPESGPGQAFGGICSRLPAGFSVLEENIGRLVVVATGIPASNRRFSTRDCQDFDPGRFRDLLRAESHGEIIPGYDGNQLLEFHKC
jgi:hypothetical protein